MLYHAQVTKHAPTYVTPSHQQGEKEKRKGEKGNARLIALTASHPSLLITECLASSLFSFSSTIVYGASVLPHKQNCWTVHVPECWFAFSPEALE